MGNVVAFVTAVLVFAASQYVLKLIIEPIQELKRSISLAANFLLRNQHRITSTEQDEALSDEAKEIAAALYSKAAIVMFYELMARLAIFGLPEKGAILEASREFNSLSFALHSNNPFDKKPEQCADSISKIGRLLNVPTKYSGT